MPQKVATAKAVGIHTHAHALFFINVAGYLSNVKSVYSARYHNFPKF